MKASQLRKMIAEMVALELKRQLPAVIERTLTERYLRKVVAESAEYDNHVPEPVENDDQGIYNPDNENVVRKRVSENVKRLVGGDPDLAYLYEGTSPIPHAATPMSPSSEVSMRDLAKLGVDFEGMSRLAGIKKETPQRLQQVVDTRQTRPTHAPRQGVASRAPNPFVADDVFPDGPIDFDK